MSKNYTLDGIAESVELSNGGARIKNNAGVLQARDNADSVLAKIQAATPTVGDDVVNKTYADALEGIKFVTVDFAYDTSSPFNIGSAVPDASTVIKFMVQVDTIFDGTTPTLSIGDAGDTDRIATTAEIDLETAGLYTDDKWVEYASSTQLTGTLTVSGATAGAASVVIMYI